MMNYISKPQAPSGEAFAAGMIVVISLAFLVVVGFTFRGSVQIG